MLFEFKNRLSDFLRAHSIFFLFNQPRSANALFAFDGEFSVVALDFDVEKRVEEVDANVLRLKKEIEYVGRIKFRLEESIAIIHSSADFCAIIVVPRDWCRRWKGKEFLFGFLAFTRSPCCNPSRKMARPPLTRSQRTCSVN